MLYIPYPFKICTRCKHAYLPNLIHFHKSAKFGLRFECRECHKKDARRHYDNHREECLDRVSQYKALHQEEKRQYLALYYKNHKELIRARVIQWGIDHRKQKRELDRRYRELNWVIFKKRYHDRYISNKEKYIESGRKRRTIVRSLPSTFELPDWEFALSYFKGVCAYCGNGPSLFDKHWVLHREHYIPLSKGGGYTPNNIIPACQDCNFSKNSRLPEEWLIDHFGKKKAKQIKKRIADFFLVVRKDTQNVVLFDDDDAK